MKLKTLLFSPVFLLLPLIVAAQAIPATVVMRAAGPADNLNRYTNGYDKLGVAMAGQENALHWKAFVIFDVASVVDQLAQNPQATLRVALDWIKSPDDVRDLKIYYVGSLPKANFSGDGMWSIFPTYKGTELGALPSHNLASLKERDWVEIDLAGKVSSGEVTPVNRYMVFRFESEPLANPGGNGLIGLAPDLSAHTLGVGNVAESDASASGGY